MAKNPESFEKMFAVFGDISHFIYWSNARYMLGRWS